MRRSGATQLRTLALGVLAILSLAARASRADQDWRQSRYDARNTAMVELTAPRSAPPRAWTFEGSGRVWGYEPGMTVWSSPALAVIEDRALLAVGSYDRNVYALDAATGEVRWRFTTGAPVFATPAIGRKGGQPLLVAASNDRLVYGIDPLLGRTLWVHSVEEYRPTLGGARLSAPCLTTVRGEEAAIVGHWVWDRSLGGNLQRGGLSALRLEDGRPLWQQPLGDNEVTAPIAATVRGAGRLFVGSTNGNIYAVRADDGRLLWQHTEHDAVRSPPAFLDGERPLVVMASKYGAVRALDAETGREVWHHKTGDRITGAPAVLPIGGRLAVVVGSYDRGLYALDAASGALRWRYTARGGVFSSPALAPGGRPLVLVSAWDHLLHAVGLEDGAVRFTTFTGRPLWNVAGLDESTWSSPAVARLNGHLMAYVGSYDGRLRALPLDDPERAASPGRSNLWFWLSFPLSLGPLALLAALLSRRERQRRRRRCQETTSHAATIRTGAAA